MVQNRSKICCLVFLSNTSELKSYLIVKWEEGREQGREGGRETLIYTHCLFNLLVFLVVFLQQP